MKILFVYPPFCTPASPPYTIAKIFAATKIFLENSGFDKKDIRKEIGVLDLNAKFYSGQYNEYKKEFIEFTRTVDYDIDRYDELSRKFRDEANHEYSAINHDIVGRVKEDSFINVPCVKESLDIILKNKPEIVAFSVIYSSQTIFTYALVKELERKGIKTVVGGPAVSEKLATNSIFLDGYDQFIEFISKEMNIKYKKNPIEVIPDFSVFDKNDYFTNDIVIPLKTSDSCYYKRCAFCTHHNNDKYREYPIEDIKRTILELLDSGHKYFFLIDDAISKKRMLEISEIFKKEKSKRDKEIFWMCQLRAQRDCDSEFLKRLYDSGLRAVLWGIESGSKRILDLMDKGTSPELNKQILSDSKKAGILNVAFIIFGFPTEKKEEFLETIGFLEDNT